MVTAFRSEAFEIPIATVEDMASLTSSDRVVTPSVLGSAAVKSASDFVQTGDISTLIATLFGTLGGGVDLLQYGLSGDGTDETAAFSSALAFAKSIGVNKVLCRDPTRKFKIVGVRITDDIEIDLGGATLLGDFGAWGTSSVNGSPIYWTKNVFYSEAADAPSITLRNMTLDGQSDHTFSMVGGVPLIDFRGGATAGRCVIRFNNFTMTRGSNRRYTAGSGISSPSALLDYRNMDILVYNADEVWVDDCRLRSSPGEMMQVQSDDGRTVCHIDRLFATKARDSSPTTKWSSSALNILNCHPSSSMRNSRFNYFTKGPVNWQSDGGLIEGCDFDWVDDSSGLDFNEAGSYRFNGAVVRNCTFKNITRAGIRTSGSNVLFENNSFHNVNIGHLIEAGVVGDPARGAWLRTTQVPLANITIRNPSYTSFNAAHTDKIGVKAVGVSAAIPVMVEIEGGSTVDRQPAGNKPLYGVYGSNAWISMRGYFGDGAAALVYLTGATAKVRARDCLFAPEAGEGVHTFELNAVTMGKKSLVLDNSTRLTALDAGWFDFRNTSSTLDPDAIHINNSPDFAGTTNNAVVARNGVIKGYESADPVSIPPGAYYSKTVTVLGARIAEDDTVKVSTNVSTQGLVVSGAITANNSATATYFNQTTALVNLPAHTITMHVTKM